MTEPNPVGRPQVIRCLEGSLNLSIDGDNIKFEQVIGDDGRPIDAMIEISHINDIIAEVQRAKTNV